jgi:hypothetical protein
VALTALISAESTSTSAASFAVVVDKPLHGELSLDPPLQPDGKYPAGTVVTVSATPDDGFTLDSVYYSVPGRWGAMYHEAMTPEFKVNIDQAKHVGASFIAESEVLPSSAFPTPQKEPSRST